MRTMTCIICPRGCTLEVQTTKDGLQVSGNGCPRGEEYAIKECTNPVRTVTATVRVSNRHNTMVSVKTQVPVAKDRMMEVMKALREIQIEAPVSIGDVIVRDVAGAPIVVTKNIR